MQVTICKEIIQADEWKKSDTFFCHVNDREEKLQLEFNRAKQLLKGDVTQNIKLMINEIGTIHVFIDNQLAYEY